MTQPTGRKTQDLDKETHELNPGGQDSSPDSDFSDPEGVSPRKERNTGDQKLVGKPAAEKPAVEQPKANLVPDDEEIGNRLRDLMKQDRKGLQKIYNVNGEEELDKILKDPIKKGVEMASKLIEEKECSFEIAKDLTVLTLYDVAILIGMFWCQRPSLRDCLAYSRTD